MQTQLPLFLKWGIRFGESYEVPEQAARQVPYVDRFELEQEIVRRRDDEEEDGWDDFGYRSRKSVSCQRAGPCRNSTSGRA